MRITEPPAQTTVTVILCLHGKYGVFMVMMKGRQVLTSIYLEPRVYEALKKLSAETGAPMAFYLRKAVAKVLVEHGVRITKPSKRRG